MRRRLHVLKNGIHKEAYNGGKEEMHQLYFHYAYYSLFGIRAPKDFNLSVIVSNPPSIIL